MRKAKLITAIVIAVLVVVLLLQNTDPVETRLIFMSVKMPRAMLLLVTFLLGFVAGSAVSKGFRKKA